MNKKCFLLPVIAITLGACSPNTPTTSATSSSANASSSSSLISSTPKPITRVDDDRDLSIQDYTINNLTTVDELGRVLNPGDRRDREKQVGVFYHIWHGYHNNGIYNITELLEDDPDALYNPEGTANSPLNVFHYWGEPLYGYYNSSDPWVITRHMELFTMAGVDYLIYDLTNSVIYFDAINAIFEVLDTYQKQGFDVPKVAFYTNSGSGGVIKRCYDNWYKKGSYSNLWYSLDGEKPLIIGRKGEIPAACSSTDEAEEIMNFFDIKDSQWPDQGKTENGFPWMDWGYPQENFDGIMSVSLAQHPGMRMSDEEKSNNGRGFDPTTFMNNPDLVDSGSNFQSQWDTVFKNQEDVNNVFLTGFNEWIAIKYADGADRVYFVDTFNEEYSRDIEMYRDGYGDNYLLQMMQNMRKFEWSEAKHYNYDEKTIDVTNNSYSDWEDVKSNYIDFSGDAMERDFISADKVNNLKDNSNRNDIVKTSITHDSENMYFKVETKDELTDPVSTDDAWMNILISTGEENGWNGFNYVINSSIDGNKTSVEKIDSRFRTTLVGEATINYSGNVMEVAVPLSMINKSAEDYSISFKVADNVQYRSDIMEYYIAGDCAPIGRLGYSYGF